MRNIMLLIFALGTAAVLAAGVTVWRRSRMDGLILVTGGAISLMHLLFWQMRLIPLGPGTAMIWSFSGPGIVYTFGFFFLLCFFVTKIRGWQRAVYLVGGLLALSPIVMLLGIAAMFMTHR